MRHFLALTLYRLLLPLLFLAAFPQWLVKMRRRGGFGTGLGARIALYQNPPEVTGAVHIHAVSVGESLLALKLIREWLRKDPHQKFVLATGTATGHAVASSAHIPQVSVTYAPLDFRWMVRRYLNRYQPSQIVLIEGEVWPHLLLACRTRQLPVRLVNARMSPRSTRRFEKFAPWLRPIYSLLDIVAIQESSDARIWEMLGVAPSRIHHTGSLKFDPGHEKLPSPRPDFQAALDRFGKDRPVILAASTHSGEEAWIAQAIRAADPNFLIAIVPRHAERRAEVTADLEAAGFQVTLRSQESPLTSEHHRSAVFVIDSTGELRDWTALADVVIIGKSFLSTGGQNPCEAILAWKPVIFGPHMENFQPLARRLIDTGACLMAADAAALSQAIHHVLDPENAAKMIPAARAQLAQHEGATQRILGLLNT
jgi:3-deoxy-D-manno-octulosonic-acid transferase